MRKNRGATKDQGLNFVLSLLLIIGSFLYAIYLFFENKAIDINLYFFFEYLISVLIGLIILHVIYIFFEGISIKIQYNEKLKKYLNILSRFIYLISFSFLMILIMIIIFVYIIWKTKIDISYYGILFPAYFFIHFCISFVILRVLIEEFLNDIEDFSEIMSLMKISFFLKVLTPCIIIFYICSLVPILVPIFIAIIYICYNTVKKKLDSGIVSINSKKKYYICAIVIVISFFNLASFILFDFSESISSHIIGGHFTNNMESVYSKRDIQIPITIQVTGVNDDLSVYLVKENSTHNLIPIDDIILESKHNFNNTKATSKKVLVGNSLGRGTYNIFINTSTITPGYYELIYTISEVDGKYDVKGFYLLDDNFSS